MLKSQITIDFLRQIFVYWVSELKKKVTVYKLIGTVKALETSRV